MTAEGDDPPLQDRKLMTAKAITTSAAPAPVGPYNQAVLAGGWLYCSGQIPLDPATGEMVGGGDVAAETRQVLKNLLAVLKEAGASPEQVVRTTVFLADLGDFQTVNELYADVFGFLHRRLDQQQHTIDTNRAAERKLRDDMDYVRRVASHAMSARAADAMGVPIF